MHNGRLVSYRTIASTIQRDFPFVTEAVTDEEVIEWLGSFMGLTNCPVVLEDKIAHIPVCDGKGDLPCDLHLVMQFRYKTANGYVAMAYASDNFHMHCNPSPDIGCNSSVTYTLSNDCVFTNFGSGTVEVAYRALPTDKNGWPTVPDDIKFIKAVEYYIREKVDYKLWRVGKIPQGVYEKTVQEQTWYLAAAQTRMAMPSVDELKNIKNNWIRLIPKINQEEDFFSTLGVQEQRNIGTRNSNYRSHGAEVDRDDYFDYLDQNII